MDDKTRAPITNWIDSEEGRELINKLAHGLSCDPGMRRLLLLFDLDPAVDTRITIQETLAAELVMFFHKPKVSEILLSDMHGKITMLKISFKNHCRDIGRKENSKNGVQSEFNRHINNVVRDSDKFFRIKDQKQGGWFSTQENAIRIPALPPEYINEIPFPFDRFPALSFKKVNRKDVLIELATYFIECVARFYDETAVYVHRYDFVKWLGNHVPIAPVHKVPLDTNSLDKKDQIASDFNLERLYRQEKILFRWAENFFHQMTPKQRLAFFLHRCREMTLDDAAHKMGLKRASGVRYHLDAAEDNLRTFLRDLPGLSPDSEEPIDEEAFYEFCDDLCSFLKKDHSEP